MPLIQTTLNINNQVQQEQLDLASSQYIFLILLQKNYQKLIHGKHLKLGLWGNYDTNGTYLSV